MGNSTRNGLLIHAIAVTLLVLRASAVSAADPRGDTNLTWIAPGEPGERAVAYEVRYSLDPLGADTTAWWAAATPVTGLPAPAVSGTPQSTPVTGLPSGAGIHGAIRAQVSDGSWGPVTAALAWSVPSGPFLQSVSPTVITEEGPAEFVLRGAGLGSVSVVRFRNPEGAALEGSGVVSGDDSELRVTADLSAFAGSAVDVEVETASFEDHLGGWMEIAASAAPAFPDTIPPDAVTDLRAAAVTSTSLRVSWTVPRDPAPGRDGVLASYELRRLAGAPGSWSWEGGTIVPTETPGPVGSTDGAFVTGLTAGETVAFALRLADTEGNVSEISNVAPLTLPLPQTSTAPTTVVDLEAVAVDTATVRLTWTAPQAGPDSAGVAATSYEIRSLGGISGSWSWTEGVALDTPEPADPGRTELLLVGPLASGSVQGFALVAVNGAGERSHLSNIAEVTLPWPPDLVPPEPVTDLQVALEESGEAYLSWSAPTDDRGAVSVYEVRRWRGDPETFSWDDADPVTDPPDPGPPGVAQGWGTGPSRAGEVVSFALRSRDAADNESDVSNVAVLDRRLEDVTPPAAVTEFTATRFGTNTVQIRWRSTGDDGNLGRAEAYELRHAVSPVEEDWIPGAEPLELTRRPKPEGKQEFVNLRMLTAGVVHLFALRAVDEAGNASAWATALVYVEGPAPDDLTASPPPAPDSLAAERVGTGVRLTWTRVASPGVESYRIYRGPMSGHLEVLAEVPVAADSFEDPAPPLDALRYSITSVDGYGNESRLGPVALVAGAGAAPEVRLTNSGSAWLLEVAAPGQGSTSPAALRVAVFDVQGRLVAEVPADPTAGGWTAQWSGRSAGGSGLPTGIYFLRARGSDWSETRKIFLR